MLTDWVSWIEGGALAALFFAISRLIMWPLNRWQKRVDEERFHRLVDEIWDELVKVKP